MKLKKANFRRQKGPVLDIAIEGRWSRRIAGSGGITHDSQVAETGRSTNTRGREIERARRYARFGWRNSRPRNPRATRELRRVRDLRGTGHANLGRSGPFRARVLPGPAVSLEDRTRRRGATQVHPLDQIEVSRHVDP